VLNVRTKVGKTRQNPKIYHGFFLPILVSVLSINNPTILVAIPSAIWPERRAIDALPAPSPMGYVKKYSKYMNHRVDQKSL
jgi:hypothetical protein